MSLTLSRSARLEPHPSATVDEVLRLALPLGSSLVAGQAGVARPVASVEVLRGRPVSLSALERGALVIITPAVRALLRDEQSLTRLITEFDSAGASAFALYRPPTAELREAAEALATPLILLPAAAPADEVERRVIRLLFDRDEQVQHRVSEVYERLLTTLTEEDGANHLAEEIRAVTGKAAYILDAYLQPLAAAGTNAQGELPILRQSLADEIGRAARRGTWPLRLDLALPGTTTVALIRRLELRGADAGFLCLLGPPAQLTPFDNLVAERAASVLAIELAKQRAIAEARYRSQGDLVDDLVRGRFAQSEPLVRRARALGYDLTRPHLVFSLAVAAPEEAGSAQRQRLPDIVRQDLFRSDPTALVYQEEGRVTVLKPSTGLPNGTELAWIDRFRERLSSSLEGLPVVAGLGRTACQVEHFPVAYREAVVALDVALTILGDAGTVRFQDLGVHRLLFHLVGHPELEAYRQDYLGPLEHYDSRHRTDLVRTVETFLACHGNHARAAQMLHLHRNTLQYRLERIRALLGRDLDDPETRLALHLALKIRRIGQPALGAGTAGSRLPVPPAP